MTHVIPKQSFIYDDRSKNDEEYLVDEVLCVRDEYVFAIVDAGELGKLKVLINTENDSVYNEEYFDCGWMIDDGEEKMKDYLKTATLEELQKEIVRRQKESEKPQPLPDDQVTENLLKLKEFAIHDVDEHDNGEDNEDSDHYMWEAVIEAVYGKEVWVWWNAKC